MSSVVHVRQSMRFKARSFMAFALSPDRPMPDWLAELDTWLKTAAGFFVGRPVVLDLTASSLDRDSVRRLIDELKARGVRIMGIESSDGVDLGSDFPPVLKGGRPADDSALSRSEPERPAVLMVPQSPEPTSLLIDQPIRSGQSVFFANGDVTVLGSVGSGAEVIAGGSIHIYGSLRGKAMAGSNGNTRARIFCSKAEPELLAIDGYYLTAEHLDPSLHGRPVQAHLDGSTLQVTALA